MADNDDKDSRTEEPTERRLSEAIEKGNVPFAREAAMFGSVSAILAACLLLGSWSTSQLTIALQSLFDNAGTLRLEDREGVARLLTSTLLAATIAVLPFMAMVAGGTIVASIMQNVPSAASDRIAPKMTRISLSSGWTRLFGRNGWIEFAKSVVKLIAVATITFFVLRSQFPGFLETLHADPVLLPGTMMDNVTHFLGVLTVTSLLLAIADLTWSRIKWRRDLRMTRHEIMEELKQSEGDPYIKARIRAIGRQRSSRRMLDKLPQASMVITNPTHFAVALRYVREEGGAPIVLAKGVDHLALKIREIAAAHDVPVVENKPLARALYEKVEVDSQIPAEFYRAVAEIIHFLNSRNRLPSHSRVG